MKKIFLIIFYIISIILLLISIYLIIDWCIDNKQNKNTLEHLETITQIKEEKDKYPYIITDISALQEENNETIGWIKVPDTNINYPVVQTTNNDYYLKNNFNKKNNSAGWIFLDYRNDLNMNDSNLIIYGHNRLDKSMFGTLNNLLEEDWHSKNKYIFFNTKDSYNTYQVFSVYTVNINDFKNNINFRSDSEYKDYLDKAIHNSLFNLNVDVNYNDRILTLYTCSSKDNERTIVHAKLVQKKKA